MNLHLSQRHSVVTSNDEKTTKILGYLKKYSTGSPQPAATSLHEVNRDTAVCQDLWPFEMVAKDGFVSFVGKTLPSLHLPTPGTLVRSAAKAKLSEVNSICLMLDGWTDTRQDLTLVYVLHFWTNGHSLLSSWTVMSCHHTHHGLLQITLVCC